MKVCVLGGTGLLGSEFVRALLEGEWNFIAPPRAELDVLDRAAVLKYLSAQAPDLIICCAAYTDVDGAESDIEACNALNVGLVETLVESQIPLIHFSTDYVFNAPLGLEIPEDHPRDPQSVYGRSKAQAEEILETAETQWWNIRTSWLHGPGGKNFVSTILKLSEDRDELSIIDDQMGRPTYAPDLAEFVMDQFVRTQPAKGHYHLQNQGEPISWAVWAEYFLRQHGWVGEIKKISTAEFGAPAARPQNSVLRNTKLVENLGDWQKVTYD